MTTKQELLEAIKGVAVAVEAQRTLIGALTDLVAQALRELERDTKSDPTEITVTDGAGRVIARERLVGGALCGVCGKPKVADSTRADPVIPCCRCTEPGFEFKAVLPTVTTWSVFGCVPSDLEHLARELRRRGWQTMLEHGDPPRLVWWKGSGVGNGGSLEADGGDYEVNLDTGEVTRWTDR